MWWLYNLETGEPYYKNEDYKNGCFHNFHEFIFFTVLKARKNRQNNEH